MNTIEKLRSAECLFLKKLALALDEFIEVDIDIYVGENGSGVFTFCNPRYEYSFILKFNYICRSCYTIHTERKNCGCRNFRYVYGYNYFNQDLVNSIEKKLPKNIFLTARKNDQHIKIGFKLPDPKPLLIRDFSKLDLQIGEGDFQLGDTMVWRDMLIVYGGRYFKSQWESGLNSGLSSGNYKDYIRLVYYGSVEKPEDIAKLYKDCDYFCDDYGKTWCFNYMVSTKKLETMKDLGLIL